MSYYPIPTPVRSNIALLMVTYQVLHVALLLKARSDIIGGQWASCWAGYWAAEWPKSGPFLILEQWNQFLFSTFVCVPKSNLKSQYDYTFIFLPKFNNTLTPYSFFLKFCSQVIFRFCSQFCHPNNTLIKIRIHFQLSCVHKSHEMKLEFILTWNSEFDFRFC